MSWKLEANGIDGRNLVIIEPVIDDGPADEIRHVRIKVTPQAGGEKPTLPFFPPGAVYRDRSGTKYTILATEVYEVGPDDGEGSMWGYQYLAALGVHRLADLPSQY